MTERVKNLVDFFKENPNEVPGCGIFNSRNTAGDHMTTIYDEPADGVVVDACYGYDYIEIFGLTDEEFNNAAREITKLYVVRFQTQMNNLIKP